MTRRSLACLVLAAGLAGACGAPAAANDAAWLKREIARAKAGAVIEVPAGTYDLADLEIARDLTLRGADKDAVIFHSAEVLLKGILVPLAGASLRVENITFRDANSWDRNGAGIRHEGRDLTVVNCLFDNNEDGILATGDPAGVITISGSQFVDSGFGDGQSHAIYVVQAARLSIDASRFVGTRIGHHVKSLARETSVTNSHLDDGIGRSSYTVDASGGGKVRIAGNVIIQSATSENHAIVNYDLSRGGEALGLVIENNRIVNRYDGGVLLRNDTKARPVITGNDVINEGRRPLKM